MKNVRILSLLFFLSLAWIACEDRTRVRVEDNRDESEAALEDAYRTSKGELERTIAELREDINIKIEAAERDLENATDDTRTEINVRLDNYRERRTDLDRLADRIANATAEGWAELETEAAEVIADIKDAID